MRWYPHAIRNNFKNHNSAGKKKSTESSTMQKDLMAIKSARLDPHCRILYNTFPLSQCEYLHGIIIKKIGSDIILSIFLIFVIIL